MPCYACWTSCSLCFPEILLKVPIDRSVLPVLQIILAVIPPLPGSIHHLLQGDDKSHEPQWNQQLTSITSHPLAGGCCVQLHRFYFHISCSWETSSIALLARVCLFVGVVAFFFLFFCASTTLKLLVVSEAQVIMQASIHQFLSGVLALHGTSQVWYETCSVCDHLGTFFPLLLLPHWKAKNVRNLSWSWRRSRISAFRNGYDDALTNLGSIFPEKQGQLVK